MFILSLNSCTIQKRIYNKGFYIEKNNNSIFNKKQVVFKSSNENTKSFELIELKKKLSLLFIKIKMSMLYLIKMNVI